MPPTSISRARRLPSSENHRPPCLSNTRSFGPRSECSPHLSTTVSTLPVCKVDPLDRAAEIIIGLRARHDHVPGRNPAEAAIVADVHLAVGPERGAVGAARNLRHHFLAAVRPDPRQPAAADFDQQHRTIRHHDRAFGKLEAGGENANIGHGNPPASYGCRRISGLIPHAQRFRCAMLWQSRYRLPSNWLAAGQPSGTVCPDRRRIRRPPARSAASARYLHRNPQILTMPRKCAANRRRIVRA